MLDHILSNWKTSAAGIAVGLLTIFGVLAQYHIRSWADLGAALAASPFILIGAILAALLGLTASDSRKPTELTKSGNGQKLGALALIFLMTALPFMQGCGTTSAELKSDGQTLATALSNLGSAIQATDPATAAKLQTAAAAVQAAAAASSAGPQWEQALNAAVAGAEVVLAAIPVTAPYAALVAIAVPAIEFILTDTMAPPTVARVTAPAEGQNLIVYSRFGRGIVHHRLGRSAEGDFRAAWNTEALRSGFEAAAIK